MLVLRAMVAGPSFDPTALALTGDPSVLNLLFVGLGDGVGVGVVLSPGDRASV